MTVDRPERIPAAFAAAWNARDADAIAALFDEDAALAKAVDGGDVLRPAHERG